MARAVVAADIVLVLADEIVQIVGAARAGINAGQRSPADEVNPPVAVVHARQAGLLRAVNPQGQVAARGRVILRGNIATSSQQYRATRSQQ